jgi:hypothetical protein
MLVRLAIVLLSSGVLGSCKGLDQTPTSANFVALIIGNQGRDQGEIAKLVESSIESLAMPIEVRRSDSSDDVQVLGDALDSEESAEGIRRFLRSRNADLAILLGPEAERSGLSGVSLRLVGFPLEANYPDFPDAVETVPVVMEESYISPLLRLRVSQAVANAQTPDSGNPVRYAALNAYAQAAASLDLCAPVGGVSAQLVVLGDLVAPVQDQCDVSSAWEALTARSTIGSEYADALQGNDLTALNLDLAKSLYLLGVRQADVRFFDKAIELIEALLSLEDEAESRLALFQGLILRASKTGSPDDLSRALEIVESRARSETRDDFLYRAALATALHRRFLLNGNSDDLRRSIEVSKSALRLQSLDAEIEVHLLMRAQLARLLADYWRETSDGDSIAKYWREAAFVGTVSRDLGHESLAQFVEAAID